MSSFDRFEAQPSRAAGEDYGDAAAIVVSRVELTVEIPEPLTLLFSSEDIASALQAARETLKYRLMQRTFSKDCLNGDNKEYDMLDSIVMNIIK